ncbi:MAG: leucyl aminopeptidase [Pseudomonadota bacterium]
MHFTTQSSLLPQDAVIVGLFQDDDFDASGQLLDELSNGALSAFKTRGILKGKTGEAHWFYDVAALEASVLVVGLGKADKYTKDSYIKALHTAAKAALKSPFKKISLGLASSLLNDSSSAEDKRWVISQAVVEFNYVSYRFEDFKSEASPASALEEVVLFSAEEANANESAIRYGEALANGIRFARHAVDLPSNVATPTYLAGQALALAQQSSAIQTQILEEKECEALGMGSFLSVTKGSVEPAKFIIMNYKGADDSVAPVVLVGKGISFDTGGISIKPAAGMDEMKMDMGGAASVLGTFRALADLKPKINVVGLIPSCENMPSGSATKPGDVVKSMSGKTIEVLNTDAEGRLILADALTYAERYNPKAVIDIATLTGAVIVALGTDVAALYSDDETLAAALLKSSERTRDHLWRMPIVNRYLESLTKTTCADLSNIATGGGRSAGSIVAACFLREFAKAYPWAHLDIAGVASQSGADGFATGRPVSVLVDYLVN